MTQPSTLARKHVLGRIAPVKRRLHVMAAVEVAPRASAGRLELWLAWTLAACVLGSALLYSLDTPIVDGAATATDYGALAITVTNGN